MPQLFGWHFARVTRVLLGTPASAFQSRSGDPVTRVLLPVLPSRAQNLKTKGRLNRPFGILGV